MNAVVFPAAGRIEVGSVPDPECGRDEVVVRVARAGLCGTDIHIHRNEYLSPFPLIPGHEFAGEVVEIGQDVRHLQVGDRVAVDPNIDCLACEFCRRQQNNHCSNWAGIGITRPGAFAQFVAAPARLAYKLPATIDDAQAAFIEPVSCVVHAMNRLPFSAGDTVLLFGAGPIGLVLMQMLKLRGASTLVVVDRQAHRLALASQLGATHALLADESLDEALKTIAPAGFAIVADATGAAAVIQRAFDYLRPCGAYLQFGVSPKDKTITLSPFRIFKHDWTIIGTFALRYTFEPAIALLGSRAIDIAPLISDVLPLQQFEQGFAAFEKGQSLKVQYTP